MAKSFVPQLVRLMRHLAAYITKHEATMSAYLSSAQMADLSTLTSMLSDFAAVITHEAP